MKKKKKLITCVICNKRFRAEPTTYTQVKCPHCHTIFALETEKLPMVSYVKHKDVVAFGYDKKTGQEVAINKKGKRIKVSDTRYDLQRDPHGWKATGKKVKKPTSKRKRRK